MCGENCVYTTGLPRAQNSTNLLQTYMDTHASERQISLQSIQWQGVASSRDDRDVLRLAPSGVLLGSQSWPIHVESGAF